MAAEDVFDSLSSHWAETVGYLTPEDMQLVRQAARLTAVAEAGAGGSRDARAALLRLTSMLYDRLPAGHPVSVVISDGNMFIRTTAAAASMREAAQALDALMALSPSDQAVEWLLAAPALTDQQVREGGADPAEPGLIRLDGPDGRQQIPAFQFSGGGQPITVVLTINRLLDADDDPFGVADWWLGRNAWLDAVPADLIGQVDDALLVRAARAELDVG